MLKQFYKCFNLYYKEDKSEICSLIPRVVIYLLSPVTITPQVPVGSLSVNWNCTLTPDSRALSSNNRPNLSLLTQPKKDVALGV